MTKRSYTDNGFDEDWADMEGTCKHCQRQAGGHHDYGQCQTQFSRGTRFHSKEWCHASDYLEPKMLIPKKPREPFL